MNDNFDNQELGMEADDEDNDQIETDRTNTDFKGCQLLSKSDAFAKKKQEIDSKNEA